MDIVWVIAADGRVRYKLVSKSMFLTGWDVGGYWKLSGDQLTIELQETPPMPALLGQNWEGQTMTFRIRQLTDEMLEFADEEMKFRRSLAPAK